MVINTHVADLIFFVSFLFLDVILGTCSEELLYSDIISFFKLFALRNKHMALFFFKSRTCSSHSYKQAAGCNNGIMHDFVP
jgi:hypothetical protein